MSASEKLKALDVRIHEGDYDVGSELALALPQIVALVEAAERMHAMGLIPNNDVLWNLESAIAALEEALT